MGTLKYAILGLLNQQSMTGYELMKEFRTTLHEFWSAKHSQIYPELKRLNRSNMVQYKIEVSGTSLEKKVYTITSLGREEFLMWLGKNHTIPPTYKDEFLLQLFFSNNLDTTSRVALLTNQLEQHQERLNHLQNNQKKLEKIPPRNTPAFSDYMVLMGAVMREETRCRWLEQCIELCS